jgi:hypothetical protein
MYFFPLNWPVFHNKSPYFSGQTARACARKPKHRRKEGKSLPKCIPGLAAPNSEIEDLYNIPLPDHEPLFREALRSPEALDESDLSRWKKDPPFEEDDDSTDPYSNCYLAFTQLLITVMHGVRLREQNACDAQRRADFLEKGWSVAMEELRVEVRGLLERWEIATRLSREHLYHPYHNSREHAMLDHYRQWLARTIFTLYYLKFMD